MKVVNPTAAADWLKSGVVHLTGKENGPCIVPPGFAATYARTLTDYIFAATSDTPHHVDLDGAELLAERAAFTSWTRHGAVSVGGACRLLPASNGFVAVSCARPDDATLLAALISREVDGDIWPALTDWIVGHSAEEFTERATLLGIAGGAVERKPTAAVVPRLLPPRSVQGMVVVDFSALWAGPLCAHILGLAGARVIKVETPTRPDGARFGEREFYRLLHGGHESVVLDPSTPDGRHALRRLVDIADIVIEASRPRALTSFGLDAEASVAAGCTWVSITAHGRESNRVGFGDDIAASVGMVADNIDGSPMFVGDAIADPLAGLTAAALAISTPPPSNSPRNAGHLWDVSMSAVVASTLDGTPARECTPSEHYSLPHIRTSNGNAPSSGADTARVLSDFCIEIP